MKKILIISMILFSFTGAVFAQVPQEADSKQQEKLQSLYVAYITQKLELTSAEAQEFWPVHNDFDREIKGVDINLPELDREQRILDIKKRFEPRFTKILRSPKRVDMLYRSHGEWRRKLIERLRNRQNNQRPRPIRRG